jgi:hypothetical protein
MNRYLFRVQYDYADGMTPIAGVTSSYEPVCIRADTEAVALAEVTTLTRYQIAAGVTRTITLVGTAADL